VVTTAHQMTQQTLSALRMWEALAQSKTPSTVAPVPSDGRGPAGDSTLSEVSAAKRRKAESTA